MERDFADHAWLSYRAVLEHAPLLLTRCRPDATPWPEDTAALTRLREALAFSQDAWDEWNDLRQELYSIPRTLPAHEWSQVRGQLGLAVQPAIETWLADSEAFERQARAAVPGGPAALSAPTPRILTARPAPPARPALRAGAPLTAHRKDSPLSDHFRFGAHPDHGFVAAATANIPAHLADWFLVREQFEPVPDTPGLYRLTHPEQDGIRRTRQAVHDLRRHGYEVQADYSLHPGRSASPPQPAVRNGLVERRNRIAQAAATRSPQRLTAPTTTIPGAAPPQPASVPVNGHAQTAGKGRGR
ncbi:hypothetical protein [[Kitasatospora] papulosa]|uniref:hypothetical protein n=1 Tax=[Kitasatospora] papulosa TaxID=1464011 RepID=UPI00369923DB